MSAPDPPGRLLVEPGPRDGAWNMAFDEALLEAAVHRGEASLRIYRWSEPTLSLGYFQKEVPAELPDSLKRLPRVRRLSGGGAILHDREWTYSCCVPKRHRLALRPEVLYEAVHLALIQAFAAHGIATAMRGTSDRSADAAFLCFLRGDPRDILANGRKVVGSAQRRRRGAVLQHGSVLLRASPLTPAVPGLLDLAESPSTDPLFAATEFIAEIAARTFASPPSRIADADDRAFAESRIASNREPWRSDED